ncbi:MAG TPA: type II toxin-antitoxin system VapC family toxin [Terriglobales bacterium]|nr:type II toxin-antitoxin system VapC family toxin [Terriglobales bacterium]
MSRVVVDASAILALIHNEAGAEKLTPEVLRDAVCSTVNLAEVQAKLVTRGWPPEDAWEDATSPIREAIAFNDEQAKIAGSMVTVTRQLGLSPGDRACLALGLSLRAPIYTAEKLLSKLKLGVRVHVIRP